VLDLLLKILLANYEVKDKTEARTYFYQLRQNFLDLNGSEWDSDGFAEIEKKIEELVAQKRKETASEIEERFAGMFSSGEAEKAEKAQD
jgi:hypothetical protein